MIEWGTVSETRNAGFFIWGDRGDGLELLTPDGIVPQPGEPLTPKQYQVLVPDVVEGEVGNLILSAVDYLGEEEVYGLFQPDRSYGRQTSPAPIPWKTSEVAHVFTYIFARAGFRYRVIWLRPAPSMCGFSLLECRRCRGRMLNDAGLDLSGFAPEHIAVTRNGDPVPRIDDFRPSRRFSARRFDPMNSGVSSLSAVMRFI